MNIIFGCKLTNMSRLFQCLLIIVLAVSSFTGCKKTGPGDTGGSGGSGGPGGPNPGGGTVLPPSPVNTNLTGLIVNENNNPLSGVTVKAGNNSTGTNSTGNFTFNNITLDKYTSLVTATQSGYFKGY